MAKQASPKTVFILLSCFFLLFYCKGKKSEEQASNSITEGKVDMNIDRQFFGMLPDGREVHLFILENSNGLKAGIINYGATLVSLEVPDRNGDFDDITLGFDSLEDYLEDSPYFGSTVGRYANRIGGAVFTLEGKKYTLAANDGKNHLHGGLKGFDKVLWSAESKIGEDFVGIEFFYLSPDGEEGYPGNLSCRVTYKLTAGNELIINYQAETDKPTPVNLTHHSYFNLAGEGRGDILNHELMINADHITPVDKTLIPTGEIMAVENTPWDFTAPRKIGERISEVPGGYDHNYVLNKETKGVSLAAKVYEPGSGRVMEIHTTEPGLQFYSGNFLDGSITGKSGKKYHQHSGFCLEPQHFPDSPNKPQFTSTILKPGETYCSQTVFKFYTK